MVNTQQKMEQSQKKEKPESEVADSDFTCEICTEPVRANKRTTTSKCKHDFCVHCIAKYIDSKVESNIANIKCPSLECKLPLDPLSCRPVISNHLFNKWCDLLCKATVLRHYANRFVYCPYRHCSAMIVNECGDNVQKCSCPSCKNKFCFRCGSSWHAGYRCWESRKHRDTNDVLFGELIEEKKWTRCPRCGNAVEQDGGCLYIHCRCGITFCYACGKAKSDGLCCWQNRREFILCFTFASITLLVGGMIVIIALISVSD